MSQKITSKTVELSKTLSLEERMNDVQNKTDHRSMTFEQHDVLIENSIPKPNNNAEDIAIDKDGNKKDMQFDKDCETIVEEVDVMNVMNIGFPFK